eukprot:19288-Heterococcus_DN1.PRE.2
MLHALPRSSSFKSGCSVRGPPDWKFVQLALHCPQCSSCCQDTPCARYQCTNTPVIVAAVPAIAM